MMELEEIHTGYIDIIYLKYSKDKTARDDVYKYITENFAPNIYLYERYGRVIADPDVSGFNIIPSDYIDYRFVKIS